MKAQTEIRVLKVEPDKYPEVITIKNELEDMQAIVGGWIEVCPIAEDVAIVCNEEGKINGLELNRPIYNANGEIIDIIAGTFFVAGDDYSTGEFVSLTDEQIEKYTNQFKYPVDYIKVNNGIIAFPRKEFL